LGCTAAHFQGTKNHMLFVRLTALHVCVTGCVSGVRASAWPHEGDVCWLCVRPRKCRRTTPRQQVHTHTHNMLAMGERTQGRKGCVFNGRNESRLTKNRIMCCLHAAVESSNARASVRACEHVFGRGCDGHAARRFSPQPTDQRSDGTEVSRFLIFG
jgi:hypothetical protein